MDREDDRNPYAPPVETSEAAPVPRLAEAGSLSLSGQGWDIVTGMARWMRIVAVSEWVAAGLLAVFGLILLVMVGRMSGLGSEARWGSLAIAALFVMAALFALGGAWLRQAASHFYEGVLSDAERPLASGFRKLRLYLILYGVYSIFGLIAQIYELLAERG